MACLCPLIAPKKSPPLKDKLRDSRSTAPIEDSCKACDCLFDNQPRAFGGQIIIRWREPYQTWNFLGQQGPPAISKQGMRQTGEEIFALAPYNSNTLSHIERQALASTALKLA
mmetsp:Transcript_30679/g.93902  ORF Transcript_30679/g.93902 Transcript_30679/m.93902 type:complete len:113 (+) Transcript_30679:190-528(+)